MDLETIRLDSRFKNKPVYRISHRCWKNDGEVKQGYVQKDLIPEVLVGDVLIAMFNVAKSKNYLDGQEIKIEMVWKP